MGANPSVNYYEITTKSNISHFKSFRVFYYKPAPVENGSPRTESQRAIDKAVLLLKYLLYQQVLPALVWAKL